MTDSETVRRLTSQDHADKAWLAPKEPTHPTQRAFNAVCFLVAGMVLGGIVVFALHLAS